jgi:hypothetical protein
LKPHAWDTVTSGVGTLLELACGTDAEQIRTALGDLVPEYRSARPARPSTKAIDRATGERAAAADHPAALAPTIAPRRTDA